MSLKYYSYTEREDPLKSMIDWSGLTKDISDTIEAEKTRRKELKEAHDLLVEEQINAVSEYEAGLEPSLDTKILEYSQNYRDYLMQQHLLMKNGVIGVNDAKISKQGAVSTFKNINALVKGYDTQLKEILKNPTGLNNWLVGEAGSLLELSNQQLIIDPKTGRGSFAKMDADGKIDKNTITPIGAAANLFRPFQKFDAQARIKSIVDNAAGKYSIATSAYKTVSDITTKEGYDEWVDKQIDVMLGANLDGPAYDELFGDSVTITGDERKNGLDGYLFIENKGGVRRAVLTEDQRNNLRESLKRNIEFALDVEITKSPPPQPTAGERGEQQSVSLIDKFVTDGDIDALQTLLANNGFTGSTHPSTDGKIYLTKDSKTYTLNTEGRSAREVAEQLSGFLNLASAYSRSGKASGALNTKVTDANSAGRYGTFTRTSTASSQSVNNLQSAMNPGFNELTLQPTPPNPQNILNAAQTIARELNLAPSIITIVNGALMINGISAGEIGSITASDITEKLEAIAKQNPAP
jgi:hypothetical protein